jgi:hypothetical protein
MTELSDINDHTGSLQPQYIEEHILDAEAEINLKLSRCYVLPLISVPRVIKHWAKDITRYHMYKDIRLDINNGGSDHESYRRYKDYEEEISNICKEFLTDDLGNVLPMKQRSFGISVADRNSCLPKSCCVCGDNSCGCGCS